jgi:hypothetical protein
VVEEERATPLNRLHGDGWGIGRICGAQANTTKGLGLIAIGFGTDKLTVGGVAPKIGAAGMEEGASEGAEGTDELAGIAALKDGPGKLEEKLLKSLVRLRRVSGLRISVRGCQCAPFV